MGFQKGRKVIFLLCIGMILLGVPCPAVHAAPADVAGEGLEEDAEAFIRAFYEAHAQGEVVGIQERVEDPSGGKEYIARYQALLACGFQRYDVLSVSVYPMVDGDYRLAAVSYDVFFQGIDMGFPGGTVVLVHRGEDGLWRMVTGVIPSGQYEEMLEIASSDGIRGMLGEQDRKWNEILTEDPAVREWVSILSEELTRCTALFLQ